jgi:hypothetical protein
VQHSRRVQKFFVVDCEAPRDVWNGYLCHHLGMRSEFRRFFGLMTAFRILQRTIGDTNRFPRSISGGVFGSDFMYSFHHLSVFFLGTTEMTGSAGSLGLTVMPSLHVISFLTSVSGEGGLGM